MIHGAQNALENTEKQKNVYIKANWYLDVHEKVDFFFFVCLTVCKLKVLNVIFTFPCPLFLNSHLGVWHFGGSQREIPH